MFICYSVRFLIVIFKNFRKNVYMFLMVVGKLIFWFIFDENADHRTMAFCGRHNKKECALTHSELSLHATGTVAVHEI